MNRHLTLMCRALRGLTIGEKRLKTAEDEEEEKCLLLEIDRE